MHMVAVPPQAQRSSALIVKIVAHLGYERVSFSLVLAVLA